MRKNLSNMILEQFPEIAAFVSDICRQACRKKLHNEAGLDDYLTYLICYTSVLTSWPIKYRPSVSMPYDGAIMFPKDCTEEHGPIIVAIGACCTELEETVGHEIGHILITYYNSLFANDICFSQQTLLKKWKFLGRKMKLINKETGMRFSAEWYRTCAKNIHQSPQTRDIKRILEQEIADINAEDIQEVLCEEIAWLFVQERKKHEFKDTAMARQVQLVLF